MRTASLLGLLLLIVLAAPALAQEEKTSPEAERAKLKRHAAAGLSALNIYSTFGCLGLASDLYEAKEADAKKIRQICGDVCKTCDLAVEMLKNARLEEGEAGADVPYEDLIRCYYLLDRESRLLMDAADKGDAESLQHFHQAREETWAKVKEVLGIEEGKEKAGKVETKVEP